MGRFTIDLARIKKRIRQVADDFRADKLKPELERFVAATLKTAVEMTSVRDAGLIEAAQQQQWLHRINYIPSVHTLEDPSLIVKGGEHWLFNEGKWYLANEWRLPQAAFVNYQALLSERERRMQRIGKRAFINDRKQARFLYQRSWMQVARSLNVPLSVSGQISRSHNRRRPPKEPPRGYGQWRGGKVRLTAVIYNPFLEIPSNYKDFTGRGILRTAAARNRPAFNKSLSSRLRTSVAYAARL